MRDAGNVSLWNHCQLGQQFLRAARARRAVGNRHRRLRLGSWILAASRLAQHGLRRADGCVSSVAARPALSRLRGHAESMVQARRDRASERADQIRS